MKAVTRPDLVGLCQQVFEGSGKRGRDIGCRLNQLEQDPAGLAGMQETFTPLRGLQPNADRRDPQRLHRAQGDLEVLDLERDVVQPARGEVRRNEPIAGESS